MTIVRYPAPTRSGTSLRKPNAEPKSPGMSTNGAPRPAVSTDKDSVGATGTMNACDTDALSATNKTARDRKSTRLNSSHGYISYAVFCLKKKKKKHQVTLTRSK